MAESKPRKKIGLVLPYLKSRGTEKQALRLARGFVEKGLHVVVFVVQGWGLEHMYQSFKDVGADVVNVGKPKHVGQKRINLSRIFSLALLARKNKCDVLLSRAFRSNQISGWTGLIAFIPTILVLSNPIILPKQPIKGNFEKIISVFRFIKNFGWPYRIVSISRESACNFSLLYHFYSKRVAVIYNGVDVSKEGYGEKSQFNLDRNKFNICFSGSLYLHRKGLDLLVEALKFLIFEMGFNHVCLILIGSGQDELKIRDLVQENDLSNHVIFAGEQRHPFPIMKQCDVFILSSRSEGFPNALLEAMGLGVCCISSDCDNGPREIIENGKNGILVTVDESRTLAEAIMRMYEDVFLRKKLARNGLKTVTDKFSYRKMIDSYHDLIKSIK